MLMVREEHAIADRQCFVCDMKLSILIVSYNVRNLLERCLRSLDRIPNDWEVIVADNDSKDGTKELLTSPVPPFVNGERIRTLFLKKNIGFARGNIEAYNYATGEYILLLNPDTQTLPNAIGAMMEYLDENPNVWVVGPKLLNEDGSVQRSVRCFPTLASQILILFKLHNYFSSRFRSLQQYLLPDFDYSKTQRVDQVMGAALMTRRSVIDRIGFLDPGYKRIFEEVDFCYRVKQEGGDIVYLPHARIIHFKGGSFHSGPRRGVSFWNMLTKQYYFNQGMFRFFHKHKPVWQTATLVPFFIINVCITTLLWMMLRLRVPLVKHREW